MVLTASSTLLYLELWDNWEPDKHGLSLSNEEADEPYLGYGLQLKLEAYFEDVQRTGKEPGESSRHTASHQTVLHRLPATIESCMVYT